ncbi:MAG TPA: oligosaccharide flippase family protein, partial [Acetobacteraceae bacterium]
WLFLGNICLLTDLQLMNFVVGHYLGMADVGLFQVGRQIAALPITEIAAPIRAPVYSAFAKIYDNIDALRRIAINGMAVQALIIMPLTFGLVATAPEVTTIFLGSKWNAVIPLLPIIALYHLFDAIGHYTHTVMIALNRQRAYTFTYYISIAIRVPVTIWWLMEDGLRGAMLAMLATAVVNAVLWNFQLRSILNFRWRTAMPALWRAPVAAALMCGVVLLVGEQLRAPPQTVGITVRFLLEVGAGTISYCGLVVLFWLISGGPNESPEAQIIRSARAAVGRVETIVQFARRRLAG